MTVFTILAGIGSVAGDIFILAGLLGAVLLLVWRGANLFTRRRQKAPELIVWWAVFGWVLAVICLISFVAAGYTEPFGKLMVPMTVPTAAGLLFLALLLMLGSRLLDSLGNRRRQSRRVAPPAVR